MSPCLVLTELSVFVTSRNCIWRWFLCPPIHPHPSTIHPPIHPHPGRLDGRLEAGCWLSKAQKWQNQGISLIKMFSNCLRHSKNIMMVIARTNIYESTLLLGDRRGGAFRGSGFFSKILATILFRFPCSVLSYFVMNHISGDCYCKVMDWTFWTTRLTYNCAHLRSTEESLTFEYLDILFLYHVRIGCHWLIHDGTGSVWGGTLSAWGSTSWFLVVWVSLGCYCLVLSGIGSE